MTEHQNESFRIWKVYRFDASHRLERVPSGHPCGNLHGHTYRVRVECAGSLQGNGMVVDYAEMDRHILPLIDQLDHSHLNDEVDFETTAENLARWIFVKLQNVMPIHAVEVCETEDSGARYPG